MRALQVSHDLLFDAQRDLDDVEAGILVYPQVRPPLACPQTLCITPGCCAHHPS